MKERRPLTRQINNVTLVTVGPPFGGLQTLLGLEFMKEIGVTPYTSPNKLYSAFAKGLNLGAVVTDSLG